MAVRELPNKWIRKAISEAIEIMPIPWGEPIPCFDTRVSGPTIPDAYVIMSTQSAEVDKGNKCEYFWTSSILLDITTRYDVPGNPGSRVYVDDITSEINDTLQNLQLDPESGMQILRMDFSFPEDISTKTTAEVVYRKFIRLVLTIS